MARSTKGISDGLRWAVYHRDGFACAYCLDSVAEGARLSLDHVLAHAEFGGSSPANLVSCCLSCNAAKGKRSLAGWLAYLAAKGRSTEGLEARIDALTSRPVDLAEGNKIAALLAA